MFTICIEWVPVARGRVASLPPILGGGLVLAAPTPRGWEVWVRGEGLHVLIGEGPAPWAVVRPHVEGHVARAFDAILTNPGQLRVSAWPGGKR